MDKARHQFLAATRRPRNQDAAIRWRDAIDDVPDLSDDARIANQLGVGGGLGPQFRIFAAQPAGFQCP